MASSDWFRNRLGGAPAPATAPPQPQQWSGPTQYPEYQQQPVQGFPQQQPQQYQQPANFAEYEAQRLAAGQQAMADVGAGANFNHAAQFFRGSKKLKQTENESCPECGDPRYFTRSAIRKMNESGQNVSPASICMACGYSGSDRFGNGMQSGNNPVDGKAPEQIDIRSMKQITHFDKDRAEWVPG